MSSLHKFSALSYVYLPKNYYYSFEYVHPKVLATLLVLTPLKVDIIHIGYVIFFIRGNNLHFGHCLVSLITLFSYYLSLYTRMFGIVIIQMVLSQLLMILTELVIVYLCKTCFAPVLSSSASRVLEVRYTKFIELYFELFTKVFYPLFS